LDCGLYGADNHSFSLLANPTRAIFGMAKIELFINKGQIGLLFKLFALTRVANTVAGLVGFPAAGPIEKIQTPRTNNLHGIIFCGIG
jgi:uncharacterized membrane protein YhiD involved in acid resistance